MSKMMINWLLGYSKNVNFVNKY